MNYKHSVERDQILTFEYVSVCICVRVRVCVRVRDFIKSGWNIAGGQARL